MQRAGFSWRFRVSIASSSANRFRPPISVSLGTGIHRSQSLLRQRIGSGNAEVELLRLIAVSLNRFFVSE